jgi:hypothetical protein
MRMIALCLLAFTIAASAAAPAGAPELEKLRASYKAAVAKGTKSLVQAQIATLEKLRDIYTRGANLAGANKVQTDIDRAKVAMSTGEFLPPAAASNNVAAPELDKLRTGHEAEIERALKPFRETYLRELDKLRDSYTRAANLAAANTVQEEIDTVKSVKAGAVGDDKFFVGRSWWSPINSEYHFKKDGNGSRTDAAGAEFPFAWRKMEDGIVEISGPITKGGAAMKFYFKFISRKEGSFGNTKDATAYPIRDEK